MYNNKDGLMPATWENTECENELPYICKSGVSYDNPPDPDPPACPYDKYESFSLFQGKCYLAVNDQKDWEDAKADCKRKGADLASVQDLLENSYILTIIPDESWNDLDAWIGMNNQRVWTAFPILAFDQDLSSSL